MAMWFVPPPPFFMRSIPVRSTIAWPPMFRPKAGMRMCCGGLARSRCSILGLGSAKAPAPPWHSGSSSRRSPATPAWRRSRKPRSHAGVSIEMLRHALRLPDWGFMPATQPRDDRHKYGARRSVPGVEARPAHAQPGGKIGIGADEVAGDQAEQARAGPNEDGKTVEQRQHERGAEDEERDRQGETDKDQQFRSFRRGGDRHHVVERHHRVRHGDGTDGGPQRVGRRDLFLTLFLAGEPDPDPQQENAARDLHERQAQQFNNKNGEDDAQDDRRAGAENDAPRPLSIRQRTAGKRNDHGIVAREKNIDPDNL